MKHVKTFLILLTLTGLMAMPALADLLGEESFETTSGYTVTPAEDLTQTDGDYFGRVDTTVGFPTGFSTGYAHCDGDWLFVGEDMNGSGGTLPSNGIYTIELDPIDITGYNNLSVTIGVNAKDAAKYDVADHLFIYANIDNTTDVLVGAFRDDGSSGSAYNSKLGPDFNLDGVADYEIVDYTRLEDYTFPISGTGSSIVIKLEVLFESGDEEIAFDDVRVEGETGGPTNEYDAHVVAAGVGAQATISSLIDTYAERQIVHTSQVYDAGDGGLGQSTLINQITYVAGSANDISWTTAIAGAELTLGDSVYTGTINSSSIVFDMNDEFNMGDGSEIYDMALSIWLNPLPYYADHSRLEFDLGPANFTVDPTGAYFDLSDPVVESGDLNNEIDIVATAIGITTQPPSLVGVNASFTVRAGFVDENGGVDEDWPNEDITLSVNTGIGNLSATTGLTIMSNLGQSNFYNLLYDALDTGVILQATSASFPGPALTDPFDTYLAPTITVDALPLCWDGDATADAIPFAIHITIENWSEAADQDAHLKVYSGSFNPYHYTDVSGWSNSTSYTDVKPIVHIGADGSYSGWLFIKSNGLASFRPRARLVNDTGVQITGVDVFGTALDLTTQGGILMDTNGSTYTTGGNVVLAYNESNDLIGTTLAEDNNYPSDNGAYTIAPGGFIMAVCEICDENVTFESMNPITGVVEATDTDYTCVEAGLAAEVGGDVILPVELNSFTAIANDGSVVLNWTTASESELSSFEITRDSELVHTVSANNAASGSDYRWVDSNVNNDVTYSYSLVAVGMDGSRLVLATEAATPAAATVTEYALHQNFPNPFNPETSIAFDMVETGFVTLSVYNVLGQQVATLVNGTMDAGQHIVHFNAANLTSGLYLYRMETNDFTAQMKMVLMK